MEQLGKVGGGKWWKPDQQVFEATSRSLDWLQLALDQFYCVLEFKKTGPVSNYIQYNQTDQSLLVCFQS
jgi:hypothetical protein